MGSADEIMARIESEIMGLRAPPTPRATLVIFGGGKWAIRAKYVSTNSGRGDWIWMWIWLLRYNGVMCPNFGHPALTLTVTRYKFLQATLSVFKLFQLSNGDLSFT